MPPHPSDLSPRLRIILVALPPLSCPPRSTRAKVILIRNTVNLAAAGRLVLSLTLFCLGVALPAWAQGGDSVGAPLADTLTFEPSPSSTNALDAPVYTQAEDSMRYDIPNRTVTLYGNAKLTYKDQEFTAAYIHLDLKNRTLHAHGVRNERDSLVGSPVFKDGSSTYNMEGIDYSFATKKARISGVITEVAEGYLHGEVIKKMPNDEINVAGGKFTTCSLPHPHYYLALTKAKVIPNDKIITGPAYLTIADVPTPIFIPFGFFPNSLKRSSGILLPEYGEEDARGFFIRRAGFYLGLNDYMDVTMTGGYYSKGSWDAAVETRYALRYRFTGRLAVNYSSVRTGHKGATDYVGTNSYMINWSHTQDRTSHPNTDFSANVSFGSSSYNRFNARTPQDYLNNQILSSIALTQRFPGTPFSISAAINHSQSTRDSIVNLTLPQLSLNMSRIYPFRRARQVGKQRWYERIGLSYGSNLRNSLSIKEDRLFTRNALRRMRNGMDHNASLSTSFTLANHINISPAVTYRESWYLQTVRYHYDAARGTSVRDTVQGFARAWHFNTSLGASTKLYGMYAFRSNPWIAAIRHVMTPTVSLSYHPDFSKPPFTSYRQVQANAKGEMQTYSIFEQGIYGGPPRGQSGTITFSLGNNIEMKRPAPADSTQKAKKIPLLENLSLSSAYNFLADSMQWSDVRVSAYTRLFGFFNINASSSFSPYALDAKGNAYNHYYYLETRRPLRFQQFSLSCNFSLDRAIEGKNGEQRPIMPIGYLPAYTANGTPLYPEYLMLQYANFKAPWNLSFGYHYTYTAQRERASTIQTVSVNGGLTLAERWRIGLTTGYDINALTFNVTSFNVGCDLHCWEMFLNLVPFGTLRSFSFRINVKSNILRDLKYEKRKSYLDNIL